MPLVLYLFFSFLRPLGLEQVQPTPLGGSYVLETLLEADMGNERALFQFVHSNHDPEHIQALSTEYTLISGLVALVLLYSRLEESHGSLAFLIPLTPSNPSISISACLFPFHLLNASSPSMIHSSISAYARSRSSLTTTLS